MGPQYDRRIVKSAKLDRVSGTPITQYSGSFRQLALRLFGEPLCPARKRFAFLRPDEFQSHLVRDIQRIWRPLQGRQRRAMPIHQQTHGCRTNSTSPGQRQRRSDFR